MDCDFGKQGMTVRIPSWRSCVVLLAVVCAGLAGCRKEARTEAKPPRVESSYASEAPIIPPPTMVMSTSNFI